MKYQKYLVIASKKDIAGMNIADNLSKFGKFNFLFVDEETIFTENLDQYPISQYDFVIFVSKHKSESKEKTISLHAPGNPGKDAIYGGIPFKVCKTSALFQKQLFQKIHELVKEHDLDKYKITLECTHHGPLIEKPCVFLEIGSSDEEWKDRRAGFVVALALSKTLQEFKQNTYNEIAIGFGGPHYCPNFNKLQLSSNVAVSHVVPQYAFPVNEELIKEVISKTEEEVDFLVLDWKGLNSEQRNSVISICDKNRIQWKKTSDIEK